MMLMRFFCFALALVAAGLFAAGGWFWLAMGGLLAQTASVVDGCDGEVARLRLAESDFGGWFDAVLDRYADAFLLFGLTWHVVFPHRAKSHMNSERLAVR